MSLLVNPFRELAGSLVGPRAGAPVRIGKVVSYADGIALIEEPGGGLANVRGGPDISVVGNMVYFRDGAIEAPAPSDPVDIIEV